jgi:hypothetical protein
MQTGETRFRRSQAATSIRKVRVYRALYGLNLSFARIVEHCGALGEGGALPRKYVHRYQSFAQELQAEINDDVIDMLQSLEGDDIYRFGKVRQAFEKQIRDPDDVFIHAEERRRELARQGKKPPFPKAAAKRKPRATKAARRKPQPERKTP